MRKAKKTKAGAKAKKAVAKKAVTKKTLKKAVLRGKTATRATKKIVAKKAGAAKKATPKKKVSATKKVSAVQKGYHNLTPYLVIAGAEAAVNFYKEAFGAKLGLKIVNDNKIGHAELKIGDSKFMLTDESAEQGTRSPKTVGGSPMGLYLYVKNADKAVERAVSLGAKLLKPVENNFWGDRCGSLEDPFGYQWTLATHVEDVSSREIKKRAAQFSKKTA